MYKILSNLYKDYEKLFEFTSIVRELIPGIPEIAHHDFPNLKRFYGTTSNYLHFKGEPKDTNENEGWVKEGLEILESFASEIWEEMVRTHGVGVMIPEKMEPEVRSTWERFRDEEIDIKDAKQCLEIAQPVLSLRRFLRQSIESGFIQSLYPWDG